MTLFLKYADLLIQSLLLTGIAAKYGNLLNATILTGFTPYTGAINTAVASFGLKIAAIENYSKFGVYLFKIWIPPKFTDNCPRVFEPCLFNYLKRAGRFLLLSFF